MDGRGSCAANGQEVAPRLVLSASRKRGKSDPLGSTKTAQSVVCGLAGQPPLYCEAFIDPRPDSGCRADAPFQMTVAGGGNVPGFEPQARVPLHAR